jgi:CHAT domain-containing protein
MMGRSGLFGMLALLGACTAPPPEAYVAGGEGRVVRGEPAGNDARGEACLVQPGRAPAADAAPRRVQEVFCGGWTQPAARVIELGPGAGSLDALASGGLWRSWLDQRFACEVPQRTTVAGGREARLLACTRRSGGWPHVALVVAGPDGPVLADGLSSTMPVIERLATGQEAQAATGARSAALELAVARLSASAFSGSDIGQYESLMALGSDLNRIDNFAGAEEAYRAALVIQERTLGTNHPGIVAPLVHLALNLSAQGRRAEAEALFRRAEPLTARSPDRTALPRLMHYRGLHTLNRADLPGALDLLRQADAAYSALLPAGLARGGSEADLGLGVVADPASQTAVLGLAEVRRMQGVVLARMKRGHEAELMAEESRSVLQRAGFGSGAMTDGRALRAESRIRGGRSTALLERASARFSRAAPGERPEAVTLFLLGRSHWRDGNRAEALAAFRHGAGILRARQLSLPVATVMPYLDALSAEAAANPDDASRLAGEMFGAAQLAQPSNTARFVQQAAARLGASGGDARVAEPLRRLQDAERELRTLLAARDAATGAEAAAQDARIAEVQKQRDDAAQEAAVAAPGFRQLALAAVDAPEVQRVLGPGEAMVTTTLGSDHGYVFLLRRDRVLARRIMLGEDEIAALVTRIRDGAAPHSGADGPGRFDTEAAASLYAALFNGLEQGLEGSSQLIVAPDGVLLTLPFGMLLTGPADPASLGTAPWLIRRTAIVHVPGPQTVTSLRAAAAGSSAPRPYLGFGDVLPPSQAQLVRAFPADRCGQDAQLVASLARLPYTQMEVTVAAEQMKAGPGSILLGAAFTAQAIRRQPLDQARVIHLATHALLPTELTCLDEPAIMASLPASAQDAQAAFLKASDILTLKLDADLVILSACNTGGASGSGAGAGEALSGLARAFFYAGARGLVVTHWAVADAAASLLVTDMLRRQQGGQSSAAAIRGAQLLMLQEAGRSLPAEFAHPYYWAPFALVGDGRRASGGTVQASLP